MIISASRRTDIPAFYSSWFMECIREGRVVVKNPFRPSQAKTVSLLPEDVDAIVFWTRNANPLLPALRELDQRGFHYIFLYTITGYGPPLEPQAPSSEAAVHVFKRLSRTIGPHRVMWRFDPIIFVEGKGEKWILTRFESIARSLKNQTSTVIVSFLDYYRKVERRLKRLEETEAVKTIDISTRKEVVARISHRLVETAHENGMEICSCAETIDLEPYGIRPGSCINGNYLNNLFGLTIRADKDKSQRPECRCTTSQDIGEYNTCRYGCLYCYAIR
ncbi:MAG: DUF1848 domain-containing protein [Deltaproteobacteria bacterium]|nr:DUF1848 domain-containing protein [Deltaproteobacteria bacterium]